MHDALDEALRHSNVDRALALSRQWAEQQLGENRPSDEVGLDLARSIATTYRDLVTEPIHQYQRMAAQALPEGVGLVVERALKRLIDLSVHWEQKVEMVYRERLARELRDFTRGRRFDQALDNIKHLCKAARSPEDSHRLAQYCGTILGTCENHPQEVEAVMAKVWEDPQAYGLTHDLVHELRAARQQRLDTIMRSQMETREVEWSRTITETVVEFRGQLPSKDRMEEPDEEVLRDTGDLMRSLLRVPLWRHQPEKFIDATLLLVEFVPRDLATAAAQSGIEARAYMGLGFMAKKAVLLSFGGIGKSELFTRNYEAFVREIAMETPYLKFFVEVMGATRSSQFHAFLVECFGQKRHVAFQEEIIDALGNIGNADARNLLIKHLEGILSARVIDPPRVRAATHVYVSLGKLSKSPRLTPGERYDLIARALKPLPRDEVRLAMRAAQEFLSYNPAPLPKDLKAWGVAVLSQALWLLDDTPEWARGADRQESILGFRKPMTETLKKLVPDAPEPFIERIDRMALRYGMAYIAVAEVCEHVKLEATLPALEKMLSVALTHEESDVSRYEEETYWDAATQQRVKPSGDTIVAPIVYAIGVIGGPEAHRILSRLHHDIKSGRVAVPGPETARYLSEHLNRLADVAVEAGTGPTTAFRSELDSHRLQDLIKTLRGSFLLSGTTKRRLKKISAISEIGAATPPEGIEVLIEQMADKDEMIQGAARTALQEYMGPGVSRAIRTQLLAELGHALSAKDPAIRQGVGLTLRDIGTGHPEVREMLEREKVAASGASVEKQITVLLQESTATRRKQAAGAMAHPAEEETTPESAGGTPLGIGLVEIKRQYILARQEWIRGGKKGPPPEPPEGI